MKRLIIKLFMMMTILTITCNYSKEKMKTNILFIDLHCDATMPSGAKEFGGGNTYSRGVLRFILKHNNLNCLYITRKKFQELPSSEVLGENCRLQRITLGENDSDDKDTLQNYIENAVEQILTLIDEYKYKNFIIHSSYWQSGLVALKIIEKYPTCLIHTIQSNGMKKRIVGSEQLGLDFRIESEKQIFNRANFLICSSISEQNEIEKLYEIPRTKLIFTGLPIDDSLLYPTKTIDGMIKTYAIGESKKNLYLPLHKNVENYNIWWLNGPFVFYGRLHIDKGICEIIEAWKNLFNIYGDRTPPLWIIGGTYAQIEKIRKRLSNKKIFIDENEIHNQIVWWGTLAPSDLSCLLSKSLAVVTHSKYEAAGLMIIESLAVNVPVIATPYGYAKNYIKDWYNGFIVEFGDVSLLQYRMSHFIEQPYLSDLMKKNAKNTFYELKQTFDFEAIHYDLYTAKEISHESHELCLNEDDWNKILPYCVVPDDKTVLLDIKRNLSLSGIHIIKQYTSDKSFITIFHVNGTLYRADYWLTSMSEIVPCLYDDYTESASQMVGAVCDLCALFKFKDLACVSISDKLTIIQYLNKQTIVEAICSYSELFYSKSTDSFVTVRIETAIEKLKTFVSERLKFNKINSILELLNKLIFCCEPTAEYGVVPLFTSKDIIYDNCFYGITKCVISSYGMGIALLLRSFKADIDLIMQFDSKQYKDILNWVIFYKIYDLSMLIYKYPQIEISPYLQEINDLFNLK